MSSVAKIIVEGTNLSGKSSVASELELLFPESIAVTTHGYYHSLFTKIFTTAQAAADYHSRRQMGFLPLLEATTTEEVILNRLHITAGVYLKFFYDFEEHFFELEERLSSLGVWLVLLDFDDAALERRAAERLASGKPLPPGDDGFSNTKKKRDLYRSYFSASRMQRKLVIDNSQLTAIQSANEIINKLSAS